MLPLSGSVVPGGDQRALTLLMVVMLTIVFTVQVRSTSTLSWSTLRLRHGYLAPVVEYIVLVPAAFCVILAPARR